MKRSFFVTVLFVGGIFLKPLYAQYFLVLPLPYPIDYLEKLPPVEESDIEKEEEIEEAPPTEFRRLIHSDFNTQKALGYVAGETFKISDSLKDQVNFWTLIYHRYSVNEYVLHDVAHMIIYRVVDVGDIERRNISYRTKLKLAAQRLNAHKREIRAVLRSIHQKQATPASLTDGEKKIFDLFSGIEEPMKFLHATYKDRIRSQLGQKERFHQGIIWSGRYLNRMEEIFKQEGIPMELTRLPFVESSFNLKARSKVGASGIWQFIRSTGKRFLNINRSVDERNDPIEATRAAARLLKSNFQALQSWPLAVTAYNHGRGGMTRAVKKVGSDDLAHIIQRYRSRTFGFASRNFYASFLAALHVHLEYEKYFGHIAPEAPIVYDEVAMPDYVGIDTLMRYTHLSKEVLKRYNPALTNYVFSGKKWIPKGYKLNLPKDTKETFLTAYRKIPTPLTRQQQQRRIYHKVSDGDTLSYLSRRYNTTIRAIRNANQIGKYIYAGQTLVIPK